MEPVDNHPDFRGTLQKCFAVNLILFFVEVVAGVYARSLAVLADAMDFLSDSFSLGLGLYALNQSAKFRSIAALINAGTMAALGIWIVIQAVQRFSSPELPHAALMSGVSLLAFGGNFLCTWWLYKHRGGDSLQQSLWLCSRNDALNNIGTLLAAGMVVLTQSHWPDVAVAAFIVTMEMLSALTVARQAVREIRNG
jgi:cation diffusion facilitator family transporter